MMFLKGFQSGLVQYKLLELGKASISRAKLFFQRHNFKSASYYSGLSQMAKAPLIAPLTVTDKAIALV